MSQTLARKISYVWRDYIAEVSAVDYCGEKARALTLYFFFHFDFPVLWSGGVEKTYRHGPPDPNLSQLNIMYIKQCFMKMT